MGISFLKELAKAALIINTGFIFLSCTSQPTHQNSENNGKAKRGIASDDYFSPRDIKDSPYRDIKIINYKKALVGFNKYVRSRPTKVSFKNQETRWTWANELAQKNKNFFTILPIKGEVSNQALLSNTAFLKKMNEEKGNEAYSNARWQMQKKGFATKPPAKLFAYQIFNQSSQNKPSILIWAKEHGDELSATEFTTQLVEFFLYHLQGLGDEYVNKVVQELFNNVNIIFVPDMTPNKNLQTFEDASSSMEDFNGYGTLLQPFNYDSNNPDDYVLAPEAAYLKKLILGLDNLVLGIDIHTPFGIGVIAGPDDSIAENNRYLIGEASVTSNYVFQYIDRSNVADDSYLQPKGLFNAAHEQISGGIENSASYFSRMKVAPSILLELDNGIPDGAQVDTDCKMLHKGRSCTYFVQPHLVRYMPYILRLMEIMASTSNTSLQGTQHLQGSFADKESAKSILTADSVFFDRLTPLDIKLRIENSQPMTKEDFKVFVGEQVLDWEPQEKERINKMLAWINARLNSLKIKLNIPTKVSFVKTNGKEEGNLPYTRGKNIVLPRDTIYSQDLLFTICHEIFHIYTRNNPQKRDELYSLIGFKKNSSNLLDQFPDRSKILTNPDVEEIDYSIPLQYQSKKILAIPLTLFSDSKSVNSGSSTFSSSVDFKLWSSIGKLIAPTETNFEKASGSNTPFNFHPEEILAENFAVLLAVDIKKTKSPDQVIALLNYLKKAK